jgi:hypothetical protein
MSREVDQMTLDLTSKVEQIDELHAIIRERDATIAEKEAVAETWKRRSNRHEATIAALLAVPDSVLADEMWSDHKTGVWNDCRAVIAARMAAVVEGER